MISCLVVVRRGTFSSKAVFKYPWKMVFFRSLNTLKRGSGNELYKPYCLGLPTGSRRRVFNDPPQAHVDNPRQNDMKLSLSKKEWNYGCHRLIQKCHQNTSCLGEYVPCGNDGIDAHVGKRWKTLVFLHSP